MASQQRLDADLSDFAAQFKSVFNKIGNTLSTAGGSFDDIVSMGVFLIGLRYVPLFSKMAKDIFKTGFLAITFVEVSHLARPTSVMEVQSITVLP